MSISLHFLVTEKHVAGMQICSTFPCKRHWWTKLTTLLSLNGVDGCKDSKEWMVAAGFAECPTISVFYTQVCLLSWLFWITHIKNLKDKELHVSVCVHVHACLYTCVCQCMCLHVHIWGTEVDFKVSFSIALSLVVWDRASSPNLGLTDWLAQPASRSWGSFCLRIRWLGL